MLRALCAVTLAAALEPSISGLSSGADAAVQMSVAFADLFSGVGVFAGQPYHCARNTGVLDAYPRISVTVGLSMPDEASTCRFRPITLTNRRRLALSS